MRTVFGLTCQLPFLLCTHKEFQCSVRVFVFSESVCVQWECLCSVRVFVLKGRVFVFKGRVFVFKGRVFVFKGRVFVFKGRVFVFKGRVFVFKGRVFVFKGRVFVFKGRVFVFSESVCVQWECLCSVRVFVFCESVCVLWKCLCFVKVIVFCESKVIMFCESICATMVFACVLWVLVLQWFLHLVMALLDCTYTKMYQQQRCCNKNVYETSCFFYVAWESGCTACNISVHQERERERGAQHHPLWLLEVHWGPSMRACVSLLQIQCIQSTAHGGIACNLCQSCCQTLSELLLKQNVSWNSENLFLLKGWLGSDRSALTIVKPRQTGSCEQGICNEHVSNH